MIIFNLGSGEVISFITLLKELRKRLVERQGWLTIVTYHVITLFTLCNLYELL